MKHFCGQLEVKKTVKVAMDYANGKVDNIAPALLFGTGGSQIL